MQAHPWVSENEREQLCSIINCGKLSIDACAHASQNERLPLRFVLQVLFFEQLQLRTAISNCLHGLEGDSAPITAGDNTAGEIMQRDGWVSLVQQNRYLSVDMERMKSRIRELEHEFVNIRQDMVKTGRSHSLITSAHVKSRKFWCVPLLPRASDPPMDIMDSLAIVDYTGPRPRKSTEGPPTSNAARRG